MKFSEIQLHPRLQKNLDDLGFTECTKIQEQALPIVRQGKDLAGLAQTGTGKTGAFLIPLIDRLLKSAHADEGDAESPTVAFTEWKKKQFILVLVPTRELADQVQEIAEKLLAGTDLQSVSVYGGTTYEKQTAALKSGVEFVIATPGRLIDLYKEHVADLGLVRAIVFDEADRMFDMGFKDDMKFILKRVPRERQFLVFSATLNFDVLNVAYEFGSDPIEVNISRDQAKADNVKDHIVHLGHTDKPQYLLSLLKKNEPRQAIIFSNFKHNVERLTKFLTSNGVPAVGLSSLMTQSQRNNVMEQFKGENDRNILVATDVAARGLDILGVDLVMNYDLPDDAENYVHRIGRTGRAGQTGNAISLVGDRDVEALQRIEEYLKHKVEVLWLEEADIIQEFKPLPRDEERYKKPGMGRREGGEGRGERGDRGPRRGGGRSRNAGEQGDQAAAGGGEPRSRRESHRDRSSGRHRDGEASASPRREPRKAKEAAAPRAAGASRIVKATPEQRAAAGRHGGGGRRGGHGQRGGHGAQKVAAAKQAGLGAKVSGFFKKLFGG